MLYQDTLLYMIRSFAYAIDKIASVGVAIGVRGGSFACESARVLDRVTDGVMSIGDWKGALTCRQRVVGCTLDRLLLPS